MTERGRRTLREQMLRNQQTESLYAALAGKPVREIDIPPEPKKRAPAKPSGEPSESDILRAIMQLLKRHPRVAQCWRQNSGTFAERNRDGSTRYIRANTQKGMSDIMGVLKDGRTLAIEVKSRTGRMRPGQEEFLQTIRQAGGVAGVCRSVDDAVRLLGDA
jgi:VRR-NUC domain